MEPAEASSSTRIEKLIALLKSKSAVLRDLAVDNLSTACVSNPMVLQTLLDGIRELLVGKSFAARQSAAQAVHQLCKASVPVQGEEEAEEEEKYHDAEECLLRFNLQKTLESCDIMLCCDDSEFDVLPQNRQEQYRVFGEQLGDRFGAVFDVQSLICDSDLDAFDQCQSSGANRRKRPKMEPPVYAEAGQDERCSFLAVLHKFCLSCCSDLYNVDWMTRHGCALVLRELLAIIRCCRLRMFIIEHMLNVLALDRFNDFVSNHVVAPVRETCAQAVGTTAALLSVQVQSQLFAIVVEFLKFKCPSNGGWQCPFAGLLLAKYLLISIYRQQEKPAAVTLDFAESLVHCLDSENEDIVIASAEAISAVVEKLIECFPSLAMQLHQSCERRLCSASGDATDSSVKGLLHILNSCSRFTVHPGTVTRCIALLEHSMNEIRCLYIRLTVKALQTGQPDGLLPDVMLFLPRLFSRSLVETDEAVSAEIRRLWRRLLEMTEPNVLVEFVHQMLGYWLATLMVSSDHPVLTKEFLGTASAVYLGGDDVMALSDDHRRAVVLKMKITIAGLLASLFKTVSRREYAGEEVRSSLFSLLLFHLESNSTHRRIAVCLTLLEWMKVDEHFSDHCDPIIKEKLLASVECPAIIYDETFMKLTELNMLCGQISDLLCATDSSPAVSGKSASTALSAEDALDLCRRAGQVLTSSEFVTLDRQVQTVALDVQRILREVNVWMSCVCILMGAMPSKLNPLVKPLIDYVKDGDSDVLINLVGQSLSKLLKCTADRTPSPNAKIGKNLLSLLSRQLVSKHDLQGCDGTCLLSLDSDAQEQKQPQAKIMEPTEQSVVVRHNARLVLARIVSDYQDELVNIVQPLGEMFFLPWAEADDQTQIARFMALSVGYSSLRADIRKRCLSDYGVHCLTALSSPTCEVRHYAVQCLVTLTNADPSDVLNFILPHVLPMLDGSEDVQQCLGPVELFYLMVKVMGPRLNGVIRILASSILPKMMSCHAKIRECSCECFSTLVELMPLEGGSSSELQLSAELMCRRKERAQLFSLLCNPSELPAIDVPDVVGQKLRPYQREGITWLAFLKACRLHGILCDEMGLGKTLQTLCIIYIATREALEQNSAVGRSLILCPKTLVSHWASEVHKFFGVDGPFSVRLLDKEFEKAENGCNLVIASYEYLRRDKCAQFNDVWLYCVLDEGHLIRNPKTQLFKVALTIRAKHRLILSGTPVQNSVLELWSLFEFLMPGYLGTYQRFQQRYLRPIRLSRDAKASCSDVEAGRSALQTLHKQVLPFILRRKKNEVCNDLPPKIVQDYYCTLTAFQQELYEHVTEVMRNNLLKSRQAVQEGRSGQRGLALRTVHALRKLCSHPALVVDLNDHSDPALDSMLFRFSVNDKESLNDIQMSGKMIALKELLFDCGIGVQQLDDDSADSTSDGISAHRALIFCQFRSAVDLIAHHLAAGTYGRVSFLKLDGSVAAGQRQSIAERFNSDPTIDLLLLTTQVGGLGLNLTGADVVIFFDHDWNPTKDIQAMDRAHRLGQRRALNVYRLITQGTLEEKIMELQKFKNYMAEMVIGDENKSLLSMATEQLLDLLSYDGVGKTNNHQLQRQQQEKRKRTHKTKLAPPPDFSEDEDDDRYQEVDNISKLLQNQT